MGSPEALVKDEVARNGADRRVSFKLPDGSDLIYLEQGDKHIVIMPGRKQFAELTPEATGFQLQKLMTPGQIVSYLEKLKGIERVGDDTMNGRPADKYRYAATTNTSTSAGQVNTEAFFYVDKDTGLPLRVDLSSEASGNVQGIKGAKIVAEMRDISTNVDDSLFQVPADLNKVPPEQVRAQIDAFTNTVAALVKALLAHWRRCRYFLSRRAKRKGDSRRDCSTSTCWRRSPCDCSGFHQRRFF